MRKRQYGLCILIPALVGAFFSASTQAQDESFPGTFRLYAGIVPTTYKISFDGNANITAGTNTYRNRSAKSTYVALNLGGTWVSPLGIYVDLSLQQSLGGKHDLWSDLDSQKQDFSHDTYTLTGGYARALGAGVSVSGFGGAISGKTVLDVPGSANFAFTRDQFDSRGFFVGAGAGVPALGGQISGSVAIAFMKGTWKDDAGFNNDADTTVGFSLGGAYTYRLDDAWGVTADVRYQQYSYGFNAPPGSTAEYTVKEHIGSLGARISYQF